MNFLLQFLLLLSVLNAFIIAISNFFLILVVEHLRNVQDNSLVKHLRNVFYIVICSECKIQHILLALLVMDIVYRTRRTMEREEMEVAQGLQELGEEITYTEVRGLPAPTVHP